MARLTRQRLEEFREAAIRPLRTGTSLGRDLRHQLIPGPRAWTRPRADQVQDLPKYKPQRAPFGAFRSTPATVSVPKSRIDGQGGTWVAIVKDFGHGPAKVSNLALGETLLVDGELAAGGKRTVNHPAGFTFFYELREGRAGDAGFTLYPQVLAADSFDITPKRTDSDRFKDLGETRTVPAGTTRVDIVLHFPAGLSKKRTGGGYRALSMGLHLCARPIGSTAPAGDDGTVESGFKVTGEDDNAAFDHMEAGILLSEDTSSQGFKKGWEIAVRWTTLSEEAQKPTVTWTRLKARGPKAPGGLAGHTLLAIEGPFSEDPYLPTLAADLATERMDWNGSSWAVRATRNPAAAARNVLQGAANLRPLADARLDIPSFQAFAAKCTTDGLKFDFDFGAEGRRGTVREALSLACAAGGGVPAIRDGKWAVLLEPDPATALPSGHFCPRNAHSFRHRRAWVDLPHAVDVTFRNKDKRFTDDTVRVYASGYNEDGSGGKAAATIFEEWKYDGIVELAQVKTLAARALAAGALRGDQVEFAEDHGEALRVTRGDVIRVAHDSLGWGTASGRCRRGTAGTTLRLDEPVTMAAPDTYEVRLVRPDGTSVVKSVVFAAGRHDAIETTAAHGAAEGDLFFFGKTGNTDRACVVLQVSPGPDFSSRLTVAELATGIPTASAEAKGSTAAAAATLAPPQVIAVTSFGNIRVGFGAS